MGPISLQVAYCVMLERHRVSGKLLHSGAPISIAILGSNEDCFQVWGDLLI